MRTSNITIIFVFVLLLSITFAKDPPTPRNARLGPSEAHVENPAGLAERREALIDALWEHDEERFMSLAASPSTGRKGLVTQTFEKILRDFRAFEGRDLRTLRSLPITPNKAKEKTNIWCRMQLMKLNLERDAETRREGLRGSLNMIFDHDDLRLKKIIINNFKKTARIAPSTSSSEPGVHDEYIRDREKPVHRDKKK